MRKLFDQFKETSFRAQTLLEKGIDQIRDGYAPDSDICLDITNTLSALRSMYDEIRLVLPSKILAAEMPEGDRTIREYEETWQNSVVNRKKAVCDILEEFLRVWSDEKKYMEALSTHLENAKTILQNISDTEPTAALPDISVFKLFLDGVKADLRQEEDLYEEILDRTEFNGRIVRGLHEDKYYIKAMETPGTADGTGADVPLLDQKAADAMQAEAVASPEPIVNDPSPEQGTEKCETDDHGAEKVSQEDSAHPTEAAIQEKTDEGEPARLDEQKGAGEPAHRNEQKEAGEPAHLDEQKEAGKPTHRDEQKEAGEPAHQDEQDDQPEAVAFIHPRTPIKHMKLPSDPKFRDLIQNVHFVLGFLLDKLSFTGLLDEAYFTHDMLDKLPIPVTKEGCRNSVALLERKGYISVYEYEGRNIICFTEMMAECIKKKSLSDLLKRLLHIRKIKEIILCAQQDMSLELFSNHLALSEQYWHVLDRLNEDAESLAVLQTCSWDHTKRRFIINLSREGQNDFPLLMVSPEEFPVTEGSPEQGVFTYEEELPDLIADDDGHYCLTPKGLFNWKDGQWIPITHVPADPVVPEAIDSPASDDTDATDDAEDIEEKEDIEDTDHIETEKMADTAEDATDDPAAAEAEVESETGMEPAPRTEDHEDRMPSAEVDAAISVRTDEEEAVLEKKEEDGRQTVSAEASKEDETSAPIYDEDLSAYEIEKGMAPERIAEKILAHNIVPEHVNVFMCLVEALIESGKEIQTNQKVYNTLSQAIALLKALMPFDTAYADALHRLTYAIDSTILPHHYTGQEIMNVFESESAFRQEHPVEKLMAVIRSMISPDSAHDYSLNGYTDSLFNDYDHKFPHLNIVKPIYNLLLQVRQYSPNGFSLQMLRRTEDKQLEKQMHEAVVSKAKELLKVPAAGGALNALPLLMARCFDAESILGLCLSYVANDDLSERKFVEQTFQEEFCEQIKDEYIISDHKIENYFNSCWDTVLTQYTRYRRLTVFQSGKICSYIRERVDTIQQWLELTEERNADKNSLLQLTTLKKEILAEIDKAMNGVSECNMYDRTIITTALAGIRRRLNNAQLANANEFADFMRTGYILLSENGIPVIEETHDAFDPFPAWRSMLLHISAPVVSLRETLNGITRKGNLPLYDNLGQAIRIAKYMGLDSSVYQDDMKNATASAHKAIDSFKGELELAFAYGRLSEDQKEDILEELQYGTEPFFEHQYFGTLRLYLNALRNVITTATNAREELLMQDIRQRLKMDAPPRLHELLLKAREKAKAPTQNFVVAEEYINRFDTGSADEIDARDLSGDNAFTDFISDDVFGPLYELCKNNPSNALSGFGAKYVLEGLRRKNVSKQYIDSSNALLSTFPNRPDVVSEQSIVCLLNELGFEATGGRKKSLKSKGSSIVRFEISVKPDSKEKAEYAHPVDIMGTKLQSPLDVVCLFGRLQPNSIVNTVCNLELGHTAIVLLNGPVDIKGRRQIAEIFHGEKSGQNPFILIDWVLMLHLAMHQKTERLAILLSCTLPYTSSFQPFVAKGSVPDEMFIGRKKELRQILDPKGVSIVYGGRQLGKTALLERAQSLATKRSRNEYAILLRAADYSVEVDVTEASFVHAIAQKLKEIGLALPPGTDTTKQLYNELLERYHRGLWKRLLLLVDEADNMLRCFRELLPTYRPIIALSDLARETGGNFKFVLAGLHNVCRAANDPNTIFGQLGSPLCIKPLSSSDALELLSKPLSYLGFKVDPEHLEHILVNTSFYPGIVHYVGYSLVENLTTRYEDYYQASNNNPPYDLTDRQLGEIMSSGELNKKIDERINWTLDADPRYLMLACCIAYLYLNEPEHNKSGHSVKMIILCADMFEIASITSLQMPDIIGLLEEMVEMGILVKPTADTFRFRQRRFIDAIGTSDDKIQAKIQNRMGG